ncbi:hypothetical protein [Thermomonas sp.]|uniref:hypothetical protein n=1 Tax=Thermomonas sp. TaxID=1971895 RepID=UPI002489D44F|nr:hypothetical protein [Thermomonas sp.]MDI1252223.1 hypothetical protein [Thermomonas sp.]
MHHPLSASPPEISADKGPDRCGIAIRDAFNVRARALAQREDASSQLAYALAVPVDETVDFERMDPVALQRMLEQRTADGQRALMRAVELAPDKPDILFMAATQCRGGDACRGVQKALLAAAPDNMAAWLLEMSWAKMRNDPEASERAFERAAKATRYDTYAESALKALVEAYGGMPMPVECSSDAAKAALRRATGMDHDFRMLDQALLMGNASRVLPAYNDIRVRCMPQPGKTMGAATREGCRNILTRMADGDTLIERAIAVSTMVQLAADDPDASAWRERYRGDRWMLAQLGNSDIQRILQPEDYWIDEARSLQAALEVLGRWPPPADWLPEDERSRSLIQTGRPPPPKQR